MYCSDCGTEIEESVSFCPDCGNQIQADTGTASVESESDSERAPCQKCDEQISTEAMKCPQCGFEPAGAGILGSIFGILAFVWTGIGVIFYLGAFSALFAGYYTIGGFIGGLLLITAITTPSAAYLYAMYKNSDRKPTEPVEIFGKEIG